MEGIWKARRHSALSFDEVDDYCFSEDTEVLTRKGWKKVSEVSYEDEVATLNPETDELEYQHPSRLFNFEYSGKMCHFYGRHLDLLVTPDHNVYVSRYKSGADWYPYQLEKAEDVLTEYVRFKKDCKWNGKRREYFVLPAIEGYQEKRLPMNLWLRFFGWWLAEGSIREQKNPKTGSTYYQIVVSQSKANAENCKEIEETIEALGWEWSYSGYSYHIWSGYNKQLVQYLKQFGKAEDKFIPEELKNLPPDQLGILYSALMKGDGHRNQFYTKSKRLADDVQEICLKLGYSADVSFWQNRKYPIYVVGLERINTHPRINEPRSNRKVYGKGELLDYDGLVYGITVPQYHIIYVRRNGKTCWAGNCDCGNDESLNPSEVTLEFWAKWTSTAGYRGMVAKGSVNTGHHEPQWGFRTGPNGGKVEFIVYSDDFYNSGTSETYNDGEWHHIVGVIKSGERTKVYVDGELKGQSTNVLTGSVQNSYNVRIGIGGNGHFNGFIASVRIYNRALSEAEIKYLYYNPDDPLDTDHLVLWLHPGSIDTDAGVWYDLSSYGNDGTIYGATKVSLVSPGVTVL